MTTPNDEAVTDDTGFIGPPRRPSDGELATMPTVRIPWQRPAPPPRRGAPLAVAAVVSTAWAAFLCVAVVLLLVVLARISLGQRPSGGEVVVAFAGWLLAHGVPVQTSIGEIGLAPLSIALLAIWRLSRAGVHTARGTGARGTGSIGRALLVAATVGIVYGTIGLAVALIFGRHEQLSVLWWRAGLHLFGFGSIASLLGSLPATGALRTIARATPLLLRDAIRTGVVATLALLGAGAGVTGVAIAVSGSDAAEIFQAYPSGLAGQAGVTLVCLAFAPNMAAWAMAYLLGPGFIVGSGTVVRAGGVTVGEMPPLPVLAGLPNGGLDGPLWLLMAVPLGTGVAASLLLVRRRLRPRRTRSGDTVIPAPRWARMLASSALSGVVAGLLCGAMAQAASGGLDGGKPFPVGSVPWQVAAFAALAIGLGAVLGVAAAYVRHRMAARS